MGRFWVPSTVEFKADFQEHWGGGGGGGAGTWCKDSEASTRDEVLGRLSQLPPFAGFPAAMAPRRRRRNPQPRASPEAWP